jgi:hypothetical protein
MDLGVSSAFSTVSSYSMHNFSIKILAKHFLFLMLYVGISSGDLLIFRILKYEYYVIFATVDFQLLKSIKLRKREFYWSTFFVWSIRKQIFILQNSKIRKISKSPDEIHTTLNQVLLILYRKDFWKNYITGGLVSKVGLMNEKNYVNSKAMNFQKF